MQYRYSVNNREYVGQSFRNRNIPKYKTVGVQPGEKSVVYFSASHPWLSSLEMPKVVVQGLPVVVLVLCFVVFAVVTIIDPANGWAFNFNLRKRLGFISGKPR